MSTTDLATALTAWAGDPHVAGIQIRTAFTSPLPTVTPPAGTLRADSRDVPGEFALPTGELGATLDSWSSQASRMEAATENLADLICYPLIRLVDDQGNVLTTSARLSHRHADATWRAARAQLEAAGIPFAAIQDATVTDAAALLRYYPLAILLGWWHSHTATTDKDKATNRLKAAGGDMELAAALAGYARLSPDARSARVITSEILATGVARRLRMNARVDSLFGPLAKEKSDETGAKKTGKAGGDGPSALGLGSLPPVAAHRAPVDVTFNKIHGDWWLSLAGLRRFSFGPDIDTDTARTLLTALGLLLHQAMILDTRLRAGTELVATRQGSTAQILAHYADPQDLPEAPMGDLIELVRDLGARAGWNGPIEVTIPAGSVLDRLIHGAKQEREQEQEES